MNQTFKITGLSFFRILGQVESLPRPFFVATSEVRHTSYHSRHKNPCPGTGLFFYTRAGSGHMLDASGIKTLRAGDCFLTDYEDDSVSYFYGLEPHGHWSTLVFIFEGDPALEIMHGIISEYGRIAHLPPNSRTIIKLLSLCGDVNAERIMTASDASHLVLDVLLELLTRFENSNRLVATADIARRADIAMRNQIHLPFRADRLARELKTSREHLSRMFKRTYGSSLSDYSTHLKMTEAERILRETDLKQEFIAKHLGYPVLATFYRTFYRIHEMTPGAYRRKYRSSVSE